MPNITTIVPPFMRGYIESKGYYFETQDELLDLDDQYDIINQIISKFEDNEKKQ